MRTLGTFVLAGAVSAVLYGALSAAEARRSSIRVLNVRLPDAEVEQIRHTGGTAPELSFVPGSTSVDA